MTAFQLTHAQKKELDKRLALHKAGKLKYIMPDEVRKSVERGLAQSKKGLGKPHEEVMKKYSKWLKKIV